MRSVLLAAFCTALALLAPAASAQAVEGGSFQTILGPADPEEYTTLVNLDDDQELVAIDEQHAAVIYKNGPQAFSFTATPAHDSEGATVPTTLSIVQPNLVILTVHHRAGNPASGGAPFNYPISAGVGWDGGLQTTFVAMPATAAAPTCTVPDLSGRTLRASRKMLNRAHCRLGPVRGERSRGARVVRQYRGAGKSLPAGTKVGVKLLLP